MRKLEVLILGIALFAATNMFGADMPDLTPVLQKAMADLSAVLAVIDKDLADAAKKLAAMDRKSDEARKILSAMCKDRAYVQDCAIVDMNGKLSVIEPESVRNYEGADISFEPQIKELFKTRAPLFSNVVKVLDGTSKVDFEYPIVTGSGEMVGGISLLVMHEKLLEGVLAPLRKDKPCNIWVMQTDGLCIYDQDPSQINKNIFTDPVFQSFPDLISFAKSVAKEPTGAGSYSFYKKDLKDIVVKKDAVWDTVKMPANEWRVVVVKVKGQEADPKPAAQP